MATASQLVFGSMRMHEAGKSVSEWADFFLAIHDRGIRVLHSSDEYDSYALFCATLALVRKRAPSCKFDHIVKLAEPSFDDTGFQQARLDRRVSSYLKTLQSDHIRDIQWMSRQDLKDDSQRIASMIGSMDEITRSFEALTSRGQVSRWLCFPYSLGFAEALLSASSIDGFAVYRNAHEREYDALVEKLPAAGKTCLAIRPFAAGASLNASQMSAREQIDAVLAHPAVEAAILSSSSLVHLDNLID